MCQPNNHSLIMRPYHLKICAYLFILKGKVSIKVVHSDY